MTHANGRITSPASSSSAKVVAMVVPCVNTDRGQAEPPLEAEGQIDEGHHEAEEDRNERLALQLAAHFGTHRLAPGNLVLSRTHALVERPRHGVGYRLGAGLALRRLRADSRAHHV